MIDFSNFECDQCGACCKNLIVEAYKWDWKREPKIEALREPISRQLSIGIPEHDECVVLYDAEKRCCPFLDRETCNCGIYPTRPVECVMVEAGDAKCQQARRLDGLKLLRDKDGNMPTAEQLRASCEEYGLDMTEVLR